jgi:HTH-type transcriptional regulator, sugar sensing transcriptional regulator
VSILKHLLWGAVLSEENIKRILRDFGLTDTEGEVYLFLAKRDAIKGTELARQIKKDKAQTYHILKSLQSKGLVQSTLEAPVRFTPVPFEKVVESTIKAKRDEAARIEGLKQELYDYWKTLRKNKPELPVERFFVIEGSKKIYPKILEMINKTKTQLSLISTTEDLLKAERFGLLDAAFEHRYGADVHFRFLTDIDEKSVEYIKNLLTKKQNSEVDFKGRNPEAGLRLFPRMVIQDDDEILLFITPQSNESMVENPEVCLWTNCLMLVQSFSAVFEDFWHNALDIERKIEEIETRSRPMKRVIGSRETALDDYEKALRSAEKEIFLMTSPKGLLFLKEKSCLLRELSEKGVSARIMAPITSNNLQVAEELSKYCTIKHSLASELETTIIDAKHLFQFKSFPLEDEPSNSSNVFYTDDVEHITKTTSALNAVWRKAQAPSQVTLESILEHIGPTLMPLSAKTREVIKKRGIQQLINDKTPSEKEILEKIVHSKKIPFKEGKENFIYATAGSAVIHPQEYFNLPDLMINVFHIDKKSSLGGEDAMIVFAWMDTPQGKAYEPVAIVGDNPAAQIAWKNLYPKASVPKNTLLVQKDEIQVQIHGETLFVGWTVPIRLFPQKYTLPPACLQIEGYGEVKSVAYMICRDATHKTTVEQNYLDAFVTFYHPASKYSGPGTDGYFVRDLIVTIPPK